MKKGVDAEAEAEADADAEEEMTGGDPLPCYLHYPFL
jgi:hypothetical protein